MSLTTPAFLWALAALSIPLWLHLSRKRQYRELPLGTLRFLQEVLQERRKRSRFEEWPLLLLRLLAVALLAFLFARPFIPRSGKAAAAPGGTLVLLDASGSVTPDMRKQGLTLAEKALARVPEGGSITLAEFSDEVGLLTGLEAWTPRPGAPTGLAGALGWALDRLGGTGTERSGHIVLISHLTATGLPAVPPRLWPPGIGLEVLPLTAPAPVNAAVRQAALLTPYVAERMEIQAEVLLPPGADRTVILQAEGLTAKETVPLGADRVIFKIRPPRDEIRGTISVAAGDAWPADDVRPFAVRWVQPRRVLLVDGHPGSTPFEGQAYFVDKALQASGAVHGKTPFQPAIAFGLSGRQGESNLSEIAAVALCGIPELSAADARLLSDRVGAGMGLLVVLDARWTAAASAALESAGLLPSGIRRLVQNDEKIDPSTARNPAEQARDSSGLKLHPLIEWDRTHPALTGFNGQEGGDLRDTEWLDVFEVPAHEGWNVLARLEGGHPLLLEKKTAGAQGRVLVLAHPLTREWTDLPRDPLFVPLVKQLFGYLSQAETAAPELAPIYPGIQEKRAVGQHTAAGGATEIVAAAPGESIVAPATAEALRAAFGVPEAAVLAVAPRDDPALASASVPWRYELWPWAAALLLILLMVENLLSTRRAPAPPAG